MRPSELDLENELHIARSTLSENGIARSSVGGLADGPKQRAHRNNRVAEVGTIQDVKHLPAELQRHPLGDPGRLIQVHIPLGEARTPEAVAPARADCIVRGPFKGGGIADVVVRVPRVVFRWRCAVSTEVAIQVLAGPVAASY